MSWKDAPVVGKWSDAPEVGAEPEPEKKEEKSLIEDAKDLAKEYGLKTLLPGADLFARAYMQDGKVMPAKEGEFDASLMVGNIPASVGNLKEGVVHAVTHPKETAEGIYNLAKGTGNLLIDGYDPSEEYPKAVWQAMVDRYGGVDNILKTIQEDPAGSTLDAVTLGKGASVFGKAASRAGAGLLSPDRPRSMMSNSLNWSNTKDGFQRRDIIADQILKHDLPLGRTGVETAKEIVKNFEAKSKSLIDKATDSGTKIPVKSVYDSLWKSIDDTRNTSGGSAVRREIFNKWITDFKEDFAQGKKSFTPQELLKFKRKLYTDMNFDANFNAGTPTRRLVQDKLAGRSKYVLDQSVPGLRELNKEYGPFLDMMEHLERNALRLDNSAPVGLGARMNVLAGGAGGGVEGASAMGLLSVLENPGIKSRMARALYRAQNPTTGLLGRPSTNALLGLLQTGRIEELTSE
ncbi:MAG: hypothetical protein AB2793_06255 [Candidatus Thiodiazotropha sp.]